MNELAVFENAEFGEIRTINNGGFDLVGVDVARRLEYKNPERAIRDYVDEEDKGVTEIVTPGGKQKIIVINESGLYNLVFRSKMPKAKDFRLWVTTLFNL